MRPGDLTNSIGQLRAAQTLLRQRWLEAREQWRDATAERFEEQHLVPLEQQLGVTLKAAEGLARVLAEAYEACR